VHHSCLVTAILGNSQSPVMFVWFPTGVYPGSITPHNGLASGVLPPTHDVSSRLHPLDATTSSHHHLSSLPTAESTRDGYVPQASPRKICGHLQGRRARDHTPPGYDNDNSPCSGNSCCVLHSVPNTSMHDVIGASQRPLEAGSIGTQASGYPLSAPY
jgi:hypothetical protein